MSILIQNGDVFFENKISKKDIYIDDLGIMTIADQIDFDEIEETIDASNLLICAGLIDPHTHLREPGFEYKETIYSGTKSMAKGGYTTVFSMPNTNPVCDSVETIEQQLQIIQDKSLIKVFPYASISIGELGNKIVDIEELSKYTIAFSDDGRGVQSTDLMKEAMQRVNAVNGIVVAHCEDEKLLKNGGCIHDGVKAKEFNLEGISSASEYEMLKRDLQLAKETKCQYHACHISCAESVELIRQAKKDGVNCSCEVTVHHLLLNENDISEDHGRFKMNPPLRTLQDQQALIEGIKDKTIDMICTDHAPHSDEEKSRGLQNSAMGIIGSEIAFPLIYTKLVKNKVITLTQAIDLMSYNCANIFGIEGGDLVNFEKCNLAIFDLNKRDKITEKYLISKGKSTPFINEYIHGVCLMTIVDGKIIFRRDI